MRCRSATSTGSSRSRSTATAKILGIRGRLLHDQGAYALQDVNQPYNSAKALTGTYVVPALHMDIAVAATNKTPVSSVRGAGYPQASFAMERLMDTVARELGLDRAELRRRNLIPADRMPYTAAAQGALRRADRVRQRRLPGLPGRGARGRRLGRFPAPPGRGARARAPYRHRACACAQGHRPRAVRVRHRPRVADRTRLGLHRRRRDGAGPRHRAGADLRPGARPQGRGHPRGGGRHRDGRGRPRRLRQPADRDGRLLGDAGGARRAATRRRSSRATCSRRPSTTSRWSTARCAWSARPSSR